jgi:hypothetical protein
MEREYYYIVNERNKVVCEYYCTLNEAEMLARFSGCALYLHFPYEEYGYEDPYNFIAEWSVYSDENCRLKVIVGENNLIRLEECV